MDSYRSRRTPPPRYDEYRDTSRSRQHRSRSRSPYRGGSRRPYPQSHQHRHHNHHHNRRDYDAEWDPTVAIDYNDKSHEASNNGDKDVSPTAEPLPWILIRNLKEAVHNDVLVKGLEKLHSTEQSPAGATPGSLRRICIIRDRQTDRSAGFALAEYYSIRDAQAAVEKATSLGDGCTVSSRRMEIGFPHSGVLLPVGIAGRTCPSQYTISNTKGNGSMMYRDEEYYPAEKIVNPIDPNPPEPEPVEVEAPKPTKKTDKSVKSVKPTSSAEPAHFQRWQKSQVELRTKNADGEDVAAGQPATGVNAISPINEQTFCVDTEKLKCCYLCNTKLQSSDVLIKHVKMSQKHAENLKNADTVQKALATLKKKSISLDDTIKVIGMQRSIAGFSQENTSGGSAAHNSETQYRDRAAERREMHHDEEDDKPRISMSLKGKPKPSAKQSSVEEPEPPIMLKGMNMLKKAGWKEGESLGSGTGITAPVSLNAHKLGVGLGHEDSNLGDANEEAARRTEGTFADSTREVARKRYEEMCAARDVVGR